MPRSQAAANESRKIALTDGHEDGESDSMESSTLSDEGPDSPDTRMFQEPGANTILLMQWQDSVYDQAFLRPLQERRCAKQGTWRYQLGALTNVLLLLGLNIVLQGVVTYKVSQLDSRQRHKFYDHLTEVCQRVDSSVFKFRRRLAEQPADGIYMDCGMMAISGLTIPGFADINQDGIWTMDEALQSGKELVALMPEREALIDWTFDRLLKIARKDRLRSWHGSHEELRAATRNFTVIPMNILHGELPFIELCATQDSHTCTNLEGREILASRIPLPNGTAYAANERIEICRDVLHEYCPVLFGERFYLYRDRSQDLCGEQSSVWRRDLNLRQVWYHRSYQYDLSADGFSSWQYFVFLFVILFIWMSAILKEFRRMGEWWRMMWQIPVRDKGPHLQYSGEDDSYEVVAIPHRHWHLTVWLNLVPRMLIMVALMTVGNLYLVRAESYTDLIMNSVSLAFLIEIDEMVFASLVRHEDQDILAKIKPFQARSLSTRIHGRNDATLGFATMIIFCALIFEAYCYVSPGGKVNMGIMLKCLCENLGTGCVSAQILGGVEQFQPPSGY